MKHLLIIMTATIIFLPCVAIVSESDTPLPNILGLIYAAALVIYSYTKSGKKRIISLYRAILRLYEKIGL